MPPYKGSAALGGGCEGVPGFLTPLNFNLPTS